jgi:hypothetical protein
MGGEREKRGDMLEEETTCIGGLREKRVIFINYAHELRQ